MKILAVGGHTDSTILNDVELFNPDTSDNNCTKPQNYPQNIEGLCGENSLVCGGHNDANDYPNECYELVDGHWRDAGSLAYGRRFAACQMLNNGSFWISGGFNVNDYNIPSSSEIRIDDSTGFLPSTQLPVPMDRHCVAKIDNSRLFIAGNSQLGYEKLAYVVHVQSNDFTFEPISPMNNDRFAAGCGTINYISGENGDPANETRLIVAGGPKKVSRTTEIYSFSSNSWTTGPDLPRGFQYGGYISDSQHPLILVGGLDEKGNYAKDVMEYNLTTNKFEILDGKLNTARKYFAVSALETIDNC